MTEYAQCAGEQLWPVQQDPHLASLLASALPVKLHSCLSSIYKSMGSARLSSR